MTRPVESGSTRISILARWAVARDTKQPNNAILQSAIPAYRPEAGKIVAAIRRAAKACCGSPVKRARALAVLLLAALAWGSAVEFTHHHGAAAKSDESLYTTAQSAAADVATQVNQGTTTGTSSKTTTGAECLICQLHQNLSASEISHTPGVGPTETRALNPPPSLVLHLSEFTAP